MSVEGERVDIWAAHAPGVRWPCPKCATLLPVKDHSEEREWRDLDSCQFKTFLHARPPRIRCPTHGTRQVKLPWAEARSRFTHSLSAWRLMCCMKPRCAVRPGS